MAFAFSNLPVVSQVQKTSSSDDTVQFFEAYNKKQLEFKASDSDAAIAFFRKRGMDEVAAQSTAYILLKQCKQDGLDPFAVLDRLKNFDDVKLDETLGEILNINRIKTSTLGQTAIVDEDNPAKRNIVA